MQETQRTWLVALVLAAASFSPAVSQTGGTCPAGSRPAATLLVPYFEVDLAKATGRTTLYSIQNTSAEWVVARSVLWTNWGLPTLAFDVFLAGRGSQSIDLRALLVDGRLPETGPPEVLISPPPFPSCHRPLTNPVLDAESLARLRAQHTGQPSPEDGLCYSTAAGDPELAVGYVTVDVLNDCSDTIRYPGDEGYFIAGGKGVASNMNLLTGDFVLMNGDDDSAQGLRAVSVVADAELFSGDGPSLGGSFYEIPAGFDWPDQRVPLATVNQARFLNGGAFDGGTDLILWHGGLFLRPEKCEFGPASPGTADYAFLFVNEASDAMAEADLPSLERTRRLAVGGDELPVDLRFGTVEIVGRRVDCAICGVPSEATPLQVWAASLMRAEGRFSVGYPATRIQDLCP